MKSDRNSVDPFAQDMADRTDLPTEAPESVWDDDCICTTEWWVPTCPVHPQKEVVVIECQYPDCSREAKGTVIHSSLGVLPEAGWARVGPVEKAEHYCPEHIYKWAADIRATNRLS